MWLCCNQKKQWCGFKNFVCLSSGKAPHTDKAIEFILLLCNFCETMVRTMFCFCLLASFICRFLMFLTHKTSSSGRERGDECRQGQQLPSFVGTERKDSANCWNARNLYLHEYLVSNITIENQLKGLT